MYLGHYAFDGDPKLLAAGLPAPRVAGIGEVVNVLRKEPVG